MAVAAPVALLLLAQAAAEPASTRAPVNAPVARPSDKPDRCAPQSADSNVIVICSERQEGYRINPDVMEAHKEARSAGRPVRPGGKPIPQCTVGPQPCMYGGINLLGVALTAAEMAKRVASGQEIGSMFETDPTPSEYDLYKMAKQRREAEEAQAAAEAAAKKAKAAAAARSAASVTAAPKQQ
jgi:hypothetical protein